MSARSVKKECDRLASLYRQGILDTPPSEDFDGIVRLAALTGSFPVAAISLVDDHREWFKASVGISIKEMPREHAFCRYTVEQEDFLIVEDTNLDSRFVNNPLVTGPPYVRFYAGMPIFSDDGYAIGSLCVVDFKPSTLSATQADMLRLLAGQVSSHISAFRSNLRVQQLLLEQRQTNTDISRLAAIVESSDEAIIAADLSGIITSWNHGAEKLYGYSRDEMIGKHANSYSKSSDSGITAEVLELATRGDLAGPIDVSRVCKDGSCIDVSISISSVKDANDNVTGFSWIARDVTRRKLAETAVIESENRLKLLTDAAFEGIAVIQNYRMADANTALALELGYADGNELRGVKVEDLVPPEYRELVLEKIASSSEMPYEALLQRKDGTTFLADIRGRHTNVGGVPTRITAIRNITRQHELERELKERDSALRAILDHAPVILYAADANGIITFSEGTGLSVLGLAPGEAVGRSVFDFSGGNAANVANTRRALAGEAVCFDANSNGIYLHTELSPMFDDDGKQTGFIGVCFDVTQRIESEERFRFLFDHSSHAHLIFSESVGIIECNTAAITMMRCEDKSLVIGKHPASLSPELQPDGRRSDEVGAEMCALARENGSHVFEWQHMAFDGQLLSIEVTLNQVALGGTPFLLAVWNDLTARKEAEQIVRDQTEALEFQKRELEKANAELEALASTDGLTGLKNHRTFWERMSEEYSRSERYATPLSVILLDVDRFKRFNDTHGHLAGDGVLRAVGNVLRDCARETDVVARYGGEEFVVILPATDITGASAFAERMRLAIETYRWSLQPVTASFGVAAMRLGDHGAADVLTRADTALYHSKRAGRNCVHSDTSFSSPTEKASA